MPEETVPLENLVYIYILLHPEATAQDVFTIWFVNNVFKEYERPDKNQLSAWFVDIWEEIEECGVKRAQQTV
jgi:hypothetical protein